MSFKKQGIGKVIEAVKELDKDIKSILTKKNNDESDEDTESRQDNKKSV